MFLVLQWYNNDTLDWLPDKFSGITILADRDSIAEAGAKIYIDTKRDIEHVKLLFL